MKRYAYRLMAIIAVITVFVMLINSNINIDLDKRIRTIANSERLAETTCTPGTPTEYYTTSDDVVLRAGANATANSLATLSKCTRVKVYCTVGSWAKVSNSAEKFILLSKLTTSTTGCSSPIDTTTNAITFKLSGVTLSTTPIYSDKGGTINFNINNITNMSEGEESRITIKVKDPSGADATSKFNIQKGTLNAGSIAVSLVKKTGVTFSKGTYTISVSGETNTKTLTFPMADKYYNFELELIQNTSHKNNPTNKENMWTLNLTDVDPTTLNNSKFSIAIKGASDGQDYTSKFKIEFKNRSYTIKNIPETGSDRINNRYAPEGNYIIEVSFFDSTYSTSRDTVVKKEQITLGRAKASFKEQTEKRVTYRYAPVYSQSDYTIEIISKYTNSDGVVYYKFIEEDENGNKEEYSLTEKKIKEVYGSLDLEDINFYNNKVSFKYGIDINIINCLLTDGVYNITYRTPKKDQNTGTYLTDANGNMVYEQLVQDQNTFIAAFGDISKAAFDELISSTSGDNPTYAIASDGSLRFINRGVGTKNIIEYSKMTDKMRLPLSTTGGTYTMTADYTELEAYDFYIANLTLKKKGSAVDIIQINEDKVKIKNDDNFTLNWDYQTYISTKKVIINLDYKGTSSDYNGTYYITANFGKYGSFVIEFDLTDGNIDYYLYSEYDSHLTTDDPMDGHINPQSNKKYEYYIGFYMIKGGKVLTEIEKTSINYRIYNRRADYNSSNQMYFYDQVDYVIRLKNVLNNKVTFDISYDYGVTYTENQELSLTEFTNKYANTAEMIKYYTFDTDGNLSADNYPLHITRFYTKAGETDMTVEYLESGNETPQSKTLAEFKIKYPEMYGHLVTKFQFDTDGNIILGALSGNYRVTTDEDGNPLEGKEVSDLFDVTINKETANPARTLTILPKTEVEPGDYFIYVSYGSAYPGVGYVNNSTEDPAISKELFPEMWNQNTHMTSFSYSEPKYTITINNPTLSNVGNDYEKVYANISGKVDFDVNLNYIYNLEGVNHYIQYDKNGSWVAADNDFTVEADYQTGASKVILSNVVDNVKKGTYRLCMSYTNNQYSAEDTCREFDISGNFYGLTFDQEQKVKYYHNYDRAQDIVANGSFVSNPDDIELYVARQIDDFNYDEYVWNKDNKQFVSQTGVLEFAYEIEIEEVEKNNINYIIKLKNQAFTTPMGTYLIRLTYQEVDGEQVTTEYTFTIDEDKYEFHLGEETPFVNATEQYIKRPISVDYFNYDYLDDIQYTIYYYKNGYIDVSSENSELRMFKFRYVWDKNPVITDQLVEYRGTLYIDIDRELVDLDGSYYIEIRYGELYNEFNIGNLNELFSWEIKESSIYGTYTDTDGTVIAVDGYYYNIKDTTIDLTINTAHEETVNYSINQECISGNCVPSTAINFNDRFDLITNENDHIVVKLKENLDDSMRLAQGEYSLVLYYTDTDYKVFVFNIGKDFVDIEFSGYDIDSSIDESLSDKLFTNKDATISIPVIVRGVSYEDTQISITDVTGKTDMSNYFSYDRTEYITNHILKINYNSLTSITAGDYMIMVSYTNSDGSIESDYLIISFNKAYFNYSVVDTHYNPDPAVPNATGGGNIIMQVSTENMIEGSVAEQYNIKNQFISNLSVINEYGTDVTEKFTITHENTSDYLDFNLVFYYEEDILEPGIYTVHMSYTKSNYTISKVYNFTIGDYERRIDIDSVEIISVTNDNKIHNNIGGIYKVLFTSNYNIYTNDLIVSVFDSNNNDVTSSFGIDKSSNYVTVSYNATEPYIDSGKYTIYLLYTDPQTGNVDSNSTEVTMYGEFKEIVISDINTNSEYIYADLENQYYTFTLMTSTLNTEEIENMKARIYDDYGNIVYSDIASDNVTNQFSVEKTSDSEYKINILAYKARVGNYYVTLCLENDDLTSNESNRLQFVIHDTYYTVKLKDTSTITPLEKINDEDNFYDYIGVHLNYQFTSDYSKGGEPYSIKLFKDRKLIQELKNISVESIEGYLQTQLDISELIVGNIEIAICLNGLVYDSKTIVVNEYIKVTEATIVMDNQYIYGNINLNIGDIKTIEFIVEPSNATNKNLSFTSTDTNVAIIEGNTLRVIASGTTTIQLSNKEYLQEVKITVSDRITSEKYLIDYDNNTIYVNSMNSLKLMKNTFINNLVGLVDSYTILDSKDNDVTSTTEVIGTNYSITTGAYTYKVVLIGDLINSNGSIDLGDVTYLFQLYRGKVSTNDENILKATKIRKDTNINLGDVVKLFQFYRGIINEI